MTKSVLSIFILIIGVVQSISGQIYRTENHSTRIQTLKVSVADNWQSPPIIDLNGNQQIEVRFDLLGSSQEYLTYRIIHCNADWTQSQLVESEYITGLQDTPLNDYVNSFNTKMDYVHYKLLIPNENIQLEVSGNYVVQVYSELSENPVLSACFSVIEPNVNIDLKVSSVTDKGANNKYQAVSFDLNYDNRIQSPSQDLRVYVLQNNRKDNEAKLLKPLNIQNRKAIYDHNPSLIFEAGNEYRSFEMTTTYHTGLNIEAVEYHSPYYHSILTPDFLRSNRSYSFYEDINGKIFIRNQDASDSNIEADYQFVHFYIPTEKPFTDKVYILSEAFHNILDTRSEMEYSIPDKGYVKTVLLKEGYYNYLYVTRKNNNSPATTALIEGDFYQTENEYRVMVYSRTIGSRYDKLIGVETIQSK